jgi:hypothetical protein
VFFAPHHLRNGKKIVDLSLTIRFANFPSGVKLEIKELSTR